MKKARKLLGAAIRMTFYCQRDEPVDHMFFRQFVDNNLSVDHTSGFSYAQKTLKLRSNSQYVLCQAML